MLSCEKVVIYLRLLPAKRMLTLLMKQKYIIVNIEMWYR